ncbi:hypothetical protein DH2020_014881 [Rehmannia glutinosa]|uniref:Carotenoid isomerase n=1 Tax=Rehmannia glutinosa TaxID=99300 RepID=A0ABR0WZ80_REHGL
MNILTCGLSSPPSIFSYYNANKFLSNQKPRIHDHLKSQNLSNHQIHAKKYTKRNNVFTVKSVVDVEKMVVEVSGNGSIGGGDKNSSYLYDAIVIGSGIGGLVTATQLAVKGAKVLVLEKYVIPGGSAGFYERDGFKFDVGSSVMFVIPLCVTLVMKTICDVPRDEHNVVDRDVQPVDGYHNFEVEENNHSDDVRNVNDIWDGLEVIRESPSNDYNGDAFTTPPRTDFNQGTGEENQFTNENLFSSVGSTSRVVPIDIDLNVDQVFDTKKELQEVVHMIALKYNF